MRSIKSNFERIQHKMEGIGAIPALATVVTDRGFNQDSITRAFTKLVPRDEYVLSERRNIIRYLTNLSNGREDNKIEPENEQRSLFARDIEIVTV